MNAAQAIQQKDEIRNGVNVTALRDTVSAVRGDVSLADFQFRASNTWLGGGHNRSSIQGFRACGAEDQSRTGPFVMDADEPPVLLSRDAGANPVEYVLHALGACLTTTMAYHAAARGIEIDAIDSKLEGDLDLRGFLGLSDEVRRGYKVVRVKMRVKSSADPGELAALAKYSPVYDIVSNSLPVAVEVETW